MGEWTMFLFSCSRIANVSRRQSQIFQVVVVGLMAGYWEDKAEVMLGPWWYPWWSRVGSGWRVRGRSQA